MSDELQHIRKACATQRELLLRTDDWLGLQILAPVLSPFLLWPLSSLMEIDNALLRILTGNHLILSSAFILFAEYISLWHNHKVFSSLRNFTSDIYVQTPPGRRKCFSLVGGSLLFIYLISRGFALKATPANAPIDSTSLWIVAFVSGIIVIFAIWFTLYSKRLTLDQWLSAIDNVKTRYRDQKNERSI